MSTESAPQSLRVRLLVVPPVLLVLATLALAVALAGPRTGDSTSVVRREGIALVLVVDRSGSMHARDFVRGDASVDRLQALKGVRIISECGMFAAINSNPSDFRIS